MTRLRTARDRKRKAGGFTLIELLVVIAIIMLVSVLAIAMIMPALQQQEVSEGARILQATLLGARDAAVRANAPHGVRLIADKALSDPNLPNPRPVYVYSSLVTIESAPDYSEGLLSLDTFAYTQTTFPNLLAVYGPILDITNTFPMPPTQWYWNVRVGEKIRINDSGPYYTIVGPTTIPQGPLNPEGFVNEGDPSNVPNGGQNNGNPGGCEFLLLTNGRDDNANGLIDEAFDGIDNDNDGFIDYYQEIAAINAGTIAASTELEPESTLVHVPPYSRYVINRRPVVSEGARVVSFPDDVVIDATGWNVFYSNPAYVPERSWLPIDPNNPHSIDIVFAPNGQVVANSPYTGGSVSAATPSIPYSTVPYYHFWLTERKGVVDPLWGQNPANPTLPNVNTTYAFVLPMPAGTAGYAASPQTPALEGERRLVTLNTKSGAITSTQLESFNVTDTFMPFLQGQAGLRDKQ